MEASQMLRYLGQLGQLFNYSTRWNKFNPNDSQIRQRPLYKNETRIKSNQFYYHLNDLRNIFETTRNYFSSILELSNFQKFEDQIPIFVSKKKKKKEINTWYVRIISIRIVLIVLSFTRGEHVREKNRDISRLAGVNKVVRNRVRYLRIPPMPGQLSAVGVTRTLRRRWQRA